MPLLITPHAKGWAAPLRAARCAALRLISLLIVLCLGGCLGDEDLRLPSAVPQNELAICRLDKAPFTDQQTVLEYGRVEDAHKLSFGYAKDRIALALSNAEIKDFQLFEFSGGFAVLTRSRWINPDGSKWTLFGNVPAKILGWHNHQQAFLFVVSDVDIQIDSMLDIVPPEHVGDFAVIERLCQKSSLSRINAIQRRMRNRYSVSVLSYTLIEKGDRWVVDTKYDVSAADQLLRSGISIWPF